MDRGYGDNVGGIGGGGGGIGGGGGGVEGAGSGDRGGGSLERFGREIDFLIENSEKMAVLGLKVILRSIKENMHICVDYFVTRPT